MRRRWISGIALLGALATFATPALAEDTFKVVIGQIVKAAVDKFQPKEAKQFDHILDIGGMMAGAVKNKFLDAPPTNEQLADFMPMPPPSRSPGAAADNAAHRC